MSYLAALLKKSGITKENINESLGNATCPAEYSTEDFEKYFLNHLRIIGDSREQNDWIEKACAYYGVAYEKAVKNKQAGTENLKEGDYTFELVYGDQKFSYLGVVAYERKGSLNELYNNLKSGDRDRIEREFERFVDKQYKKVVMVLEYGQTMSDLLNGRFDYIDHYGQYNTKDVGKLVYTSLMAWKQPNAFNFEIHQETNHEKLFWWIIMDMYYFFRNDLRTKREKGEIKEVENVREDKRPAQDK